jgi:serine/threonine protein kinase
MKLSGKHYKGIHNPSPATKAQMKELLFCDSIGNKIKVIQRIGSQSQYATVWQVEVRLNSQPLVAALKVQNNLEKSSNEIEIQNFLNQYNDYFLELYTSFYCDDVELNPSENFNGALMLMELAIADLGQYLLYGPDVPEKELYRYVFQVLDSVYFLGKSQLFHGDLHINNVFIVIRKNDKKAVIGDFGETIGLDSITSHTSDLYRFFTSLSEFLSVKFPRKYFSLRQKIKSVVKYLNRRTGQIENDYDSWNEQNRGPYGEVDYMELDAYFEKTVYQTVKAVKEILIES